MAIGDWYSTLAGMVEPRPGSMEFEKEFRQAQGKLLAWAGIRPGSRNCTLEVILKPRHLRKPLPYHTSQMRTYGRLHRVDHRSFKSTVSGI